MRLKTRNVLKIGGLVFAIIGVAVILVISFLIYMIFVQPQQKAIGEAKARAAYLLNITSKTQLKKVGEAGMSETVDNNNHCYTYAFQGSGDFGIIKTVAKKLVNDAGYNTNPASRLGTMPDIVDTPDRLILTGYYATSTWTTRLQVLNNTALTHVASGVIDGVVGTSPSPGQILVSGQVCNI